jgi:hypothetical protein
VRVRVASPRRRTGMVNTHVKADLAGASTAAAIADRAEGDCFASPSLSRSLALTITTTLTTSNRWVTYPPCLRLFGGARTYRPYISELRNDVVSILFSTHGKHEHRRVASELMKSSARVPTPEMSQLCLTLTCDRGSRAIESGASQRRHLTGFSPHHPFPYTFRLLRRGATNSHLNGFTAHPIPSLACCVAHPKIPTQRHTPRHLLSVASLLSNDIPGEDVCGDAHRVLGLTSILLLFAVRSGTTTVILSFAVWRMPSLRSFPTYHYNTLYNASSHGGDICAPVGRPLPSSFRT